MNQEDQTDLVNQVVGICDIDESTAKSYLEAFNWDLNAAVENILNETDDAGISVTRTTESSTGASAESNTPKPKSGASQPEKPATSGPMIATLSSFSRRADHSQISDDNEGQAFYVGGAEHGGGQQVLGPPRIDNPESFVQGIFRAARERGAETLDRAQVDDLSSNQGPQSFSGIGYRLGTTLSDSTVQVGPGKPSSSSGTVGLGLYHQNSDDEESGEKKSVVVKMWNNGFSLDDGPLRLYTDPSSVKFISAIKAGRIPTELIAAARGHEVHVMLEDHHNEPFHAPPQPKLKPFSGVGRVLGNPTPKVVTNTSPPTSSPVAAPPAPEVDESKPTTQLQVRLPDGSRIIVKLNNQHTVQDLRAAIIHQRPELAFSVFGLSIPFPRTEIKDDSATLANANLLNASIVVTKQ